MFTRLPFIVFVLVIGVIVLLTVSFEEDGTWYDTRNYMYFYVSALLRFSMGIQIVAYFPSWIPFASLGIFGDFLHYLAYDLSLLCKILYVMSAVTRRCHAMRFLKILYYFTCDYDTGLMLILEFDNIIRRIYLLCALIVGWRLRG